MNKYRGLEVYLSKREDSHIKLSFREIEQLIGDKLPRSAHKYAAWWANGGHPHAQAWLSSGWRVDKVNFGESVEFIKEKK